MEKLAFAFAIALLALGAVLNLVVLACLALRVARIFAPQRLPRRRARTQRLAPAHR